MNYKYNIKNFSSFDKVVLIDESGKETVLTSASGTITLQKFGIYAIKNGKKSATKWYTCASDIANPYTSITFNYNGKVYSYPVKTVDLVSRKFTFSDLKKLVSFDESNITKNGDEYKFSYWSIADGGKHEPDDEIIKAATMFYAVFTKIESTPSVEYVTVTFTFKEQSNSVKVLKGTTYEEMMSTIDAENYMFVDYGSYYGRISSATYSDGSSIRGTDVLNSDVTIVITDTQPSWFTDVVFCEVSGRWICNSTTYCGSTIQAFIDQVIDSLTEHGTSISKSISGYYKDFDGTVQITDLTKHVYSDSDGNNIYVKYE